MVLEQIYALPDNKCPDPPLKKCPCFFEELDTADDCKGTRKLESSNHALKTTRQNGNLYPSKV